MIKRLKRIRAEREADKPINQAVEELKKLGYKFIPMKGV